MPLTPFDILDKAVAAGGANLAAKALGDRGAKAVRDALCGQGLLSQTGTKFFLTAAGKAAWRKQAPADQVAEADRQEEERLTAFVTAVKHKGGKKFTKTELAVAPEAIRQKAVDQVYVEATATPDTFTLTPTWEGFLRSRKPLGEQLEELRATVRALVADLGAANERMRAEVGRMGPDAHDLADVAAELGKDSGAAGAALQNVVAELSGFGRLVEAAHRFQAAALRRVADTQRQLESRAADVAEVKKQMERASEDQRKQIAEAEGRLNRQCEELAGKIVGAGTSPPPAPPVADEIVSFVNTWAKEKTVGPPFDAIMRDLRARHPSLTVGAFHDALRALSSGPSPRLKLSGWSKTVHELPEPELALFIKHTVTYYAHPTH